MSAFEAGLRQAIRDELYSTVPEIVQRALADSGKADAYTAEQLARKWSCSTRSIDRLIESGELPHITVPGVRGRLVRAADAGDYLERRARQARHLRSAS